MSGMSPTFTAGPAAAGVSEKRLLTADEAGRLLRCSPAGVYRMVARGELPDAAVVRRGARILVRSAVLDAWLDGTLT